MRQPCNARPRPFLLALILLFCAPFAAAANEALTNNSVIEMVKLGLSPTVITKKIAAGPTAFDTSIASLGALKQAGVSNAVIEAMMTASEAQPVLSAGAAPPTAAPGQPAAQPATRPAARPGTWYPKRAGIYVDLANSMDAPRLERIEPTAYETKQDSGRATSFFTLIKAKRRIRLVGDVSATELSGGSPIFYFVFDKPDAAAKPVQAPAQDPMSQAMQAMAMMSQMGGTTSAESPKEFVLIKLQMKKNSREFVVGSANAWESQSGVDDESVIVLSHEEVADGLYRVRARTPLVPGEYCFYRITGNQQFGSPFGSRAAVYDFSIR